MHHTPAAMQRFLLANRHCLAACAADLQHHHAIARLRATQHAMDMGGSVRARRSLAGSTGCMGKRHPLPLGCTADHVACRLPGRAGCCGNCGRASTDGCGCTPTRQKRSVQRRPMMPEVLANPAAARCSDGRFYPKSDGHRTPGRSSDSVPERTEHMPQKATSDGSPARGLPVFATAAPAGGQSGSGVRTPKTVAWSGAGRRMARWTLQQWGLFRICTGFPFQQQRTKALPPPDVRAKGSPSGESTKRPSVFAGGGSLPADRKRIRSGR